MTAPADNATFASLNAKQKLVVADSLGYVFDYYGIPTNLWLDSSLSPNDRVVDLAGTTAESGRVYTANIEEANFSYTAIPGDTLQSIVSNLATAINADSRYDAVVDPANNARINVTSGAGTAVIEVTAELGTVYTANIGDLQVSYTATPTTPLSTVLTSLATAIDNDPRYVATANTGAGKIEVSFARVGDIVADSNNVYSVTLAGKRFTTTADSHDTPATIQSRLATAIDADSRYVAVVNVGDPTKINITETT